MVYLLLLWLLCFSWLDRKADWYPVDCQCHCQWGAIFDHDANVDSDDNTMLMPMPILMLTPMPLPMPIRMSIPGLLNLKMCLQVNGSRNVPALLQNWNCGVLGEICLSKMCVFKCACKIILRIAQIQEIWLNKIFPNIHFISAFSTIISTNWWHLYQISAQNGQYSKENW